MQRPAGVKVQHGRKQLGYDLSSHELLKLGIDVGQISVAKWHRQLNELDILIQSR
ncbi:MAG: hypothetical protein ACLP4V_15260 [Methylocella sp.]